MDIMNRLAPGHYREVDDLLAFISIYDDASRTQAFHRLLSANRHLIKNAVCVEAGCGLGLFAEYMARLGAKKVYAVEQNSLLVQLARKRLAAYPNIDVVQAPIQFFAPHEPIDVLVHEFFGQLLFDEDLFALEQLSFKPAHVLPDSGELLCGVLDSSQYVDRTVDADVLEHLKGVLVSGLFPETGKELHFPVCRWQYGQPFGSRSQVDISTYTGDLVAFGVRILHQGREICRAGTCENWSIVWTPRKGNRFELEFVAADAGCDVLFHWM